MRIQTILLAALAPFSVHAGATKTYVSAFHTCPASSCSSGPSSHVTYLAESDDGVTWSAIPGFSSVTWSGSVPDVIRRLNYFYVYNPGMVTKVRVGTGAITGPTAVSIVDSTGASVPFVDPSPILDPVTGRFVLFYLVGNTSGTDPAGCGTDPSCTKEFRSATEIAGSDGTQFLEDSGIRLTITVSGSTDPIGPVASDPDIFADATGYVLLISRGHNVQAFTSTTLQGSYSAIGALTDSILVDGSSTGSAGLSGVGAGYYHTATSKYWIYLPDAPNTSSTPAVIRRAEVSSLTSVLDNSNFSTVMTAGVVGLDGLTYSIQSPGFAVNTP